MMVCWLRMCQTLKEDTSDPCTSYTELLYWSHSLASEQRFTLIIWTLSNLTFKLSSHRIFGVPTAHVQNETAELKSRWNRFNAVEINYLMDLQTNKQTWTQDWSHNDAVVSIVEDLLALSQTAKRWSRIPITPPSGSWRYWSEVSGRVFHCIFVLFMIGAIHCCCFRWAHFALSTCQRSQFTSDVQQKKETPWVSCFWFNHTCCGLLFHVI